MTMAEVLESIQGLGIRFDRHAPNEGSASGPLK